MATIKTNLLGVDVGGTKCAVIYGVDTDGSIAAAAALCSTSLKAGGKILSCGNGGNPLAEMADVAVCAPAAPHSDRIQEIHIKVIHILIHAIEAQL